MHNVRGLLDHQWKNFQQQRQVFFFSRWFVICSRETWLNYVRSNKVTNNAGPNVDGEMLQMAL
jgi:DNA-directed RNA polymerase specialized sigma24 family protein